METITPAKILIFGYINLNVVDGSAFFISALAKMLGARVGTKVDVLSANRIYSDLVVREMLDHPSISVLDCFNDPSLGFLNPEHHDHTLSREGAVRALRSLDHINDYDAIIVRDLEVAFNLAAITPRLANKLFAYVTGVPSLARGIDPMVVGYLRSLATLGSKLVAQTEVMLDKLISEVPEVCADRTFVLGPFVPDEQPGPSLREIDDKLKLIYAGKFYTDWIPDRMLNCFSIARASSPNMSLTVAGNAFKSTDGDSSFVRNVKWMLENTSGVDWVGGVHRSTVRRLIRSSNVGVSWRSQRLDASTEFSTKVLEYGALGVPSLVNPSEVNRQMLGEDYPLYVSDSRSFIETLCALVNQRDEIDEARLCVEKLARLHSYSATSERLLSFIDPVKSRANDHTGDVNNVVAIPDWATRVEDLEPGLPVLNGGFVSSNRSGRTYLMPSTTSGSGFAEVVAETLFKNFVRLKLEESKNDVDAEFENPATLRSVSTPVKSGRKSATFNNYVNSSDAQLTVELDRLRRQVDLVERQRDDSRALLESLRSSKLGKIQRWWWKQRRST